MSAIAGLLHLDRGSSEAEPAERMAAGRGWRGPDDEGSYRSPDGRASLAARRLAMIDPSHAAGQPMANETHDVWMVLDGEILNHRALRHSLELVGHRFRSNSDAEVVLHAYEQWDLDFLAHLHGAFALGLWDDRRDRLVLARDRLGRKPLFVAEYRGRLGFASGIGPLLDEMGLPRRLDPAGLAQYLTFGVIPAPATLVAGIAKLAPGEMLVADRVGPPRRQRWHSPTPDERRAGSVRGLPAERHAGNLRTLLECAVADRLLGPPRGMRPVGVWLTPSAGSGALAAIITRLTGTPPYGVAVMSSADSVAAFEMRQLAETAGMEAREILVGPGDLAEALPLMADRLAEPVAHSGLAAAWFAARAAGEARMGALLADMGTDEVLLCHPAYDCARRAGLLRRLTGLLRRRAPSGLCLPPPGLRPFIDRDGASLLSVPLPPVEDAPPALPDWMRDDALAALGLGDLVLRLGDGLAPGLDAMAQAHGLEARLPLLDETLAAYAQSIPGRIRSPAGAPRQMLRRMLGDLVPTATIARSRPAPCLPLEQWLAALLEDAAGLWPLLKVHSLRNLLADHRATLAHGEALWALLLLVHWCTNLGLEEVAEAAPKRPELAHSRS